MAVIITLLLAGAVLLVLETVLPGLVAGTIGLGCLVAAVYLGYTDFGFETGNILLAITVGGIVIGTFVYLKWFPDSPLAARFVSQGKVGQLRNEQTELLGQTGTALSILRPCGTALINDRRVDVVTEGELVAKGTPLKVVAIEGLRVVVRPQA